MQNMNWNYPTNVWFGVDRSKQIQAACDSLNIKNPLIVTDPGLLETPIIDQINGELSGVFSHNPEPLPKNTLHKLNKPVLRHELFALLQGSAKHVAQNDQPRPYRANKITPICQQHGTDPKSQEAE